MKNWNLFKDDLKKKWDEVFKNGACKICGRQKKNSQPAFTCSKLTIETVGQGVKYVQS